MSISERRWDCFWDRVSISKQRVDCSRNQFGGVDCFENSSSPHCFEESVEKMAGEGTSSGKSMNPHPLRIDVVKFNGTNTVGEEARINNGRRLGQDEPYGV